MLKWWSSHLLHCCFKLCRLFSVVYKQPCIVNSLRIIYAFNVTLTFLKVRKMWRKQCLIKVHALHLRGKSWSTMGEIALCRWWIQVTSNLEHVVIFLLTNKNLVELEMVRYFTDYLQQVILFRNSIKNWVLATISR